ncbi:putative inorganic phosphate cotransporter [Oppia nitens]|uniref:putative inorganic phosphate cotransporter n=1 Tax=Oppia nitens TaxID=1686743 RepID=UPI0023D9F91E|nr:putative inorganic phosphate cotransporter [Oppia nitens]
MVAVVHNRSNGKLCFVFIPSRYIFLLLMSLGLFLVYAFKGFLGVAIVAMVKHQNTSKLIDSECPADDSENGYNNNGKSGEFEWTDSQQTLVLGAFFYGYVVTQIPAGIAAEKIGAKWMFALSLLITGILSLLGPVAARLGQNSIIPFFLTRLGQGLAQGMILPCMNTMIAKWMPKTERSRAISITFAGSAMGSVVSLPLTGYLCDESFLGGWPAIFYLLGIAACVWVVFWILFVFESPDTHPYISQIEYNLIKKGQGDEIITSKRQIPWKSILTSYHVYASIVAHFGFNWGYLTLLTLLPTYFTNILHMNIKTNGLISSLPYIANTIVSCLASYITDKLRERGVNITLLRKINNSIAFFGTGIFLIAVILSKCNKTWSIVFFVIGLGLNGCSYSGFLANYVDMAPDFAGILMGFCNAFGNIPGFAAPQTASLIYKNGQTLETWSYSYNLGV